MDPRARTFAALTKLMHGMQVPADNPLISPEDAQPAPAPEMAQPEPAPESEEERFARIRAMMMQGK